MENYKFYRSWMYDHMYAGRRGLKPIFEEGVKLFITWAFDQECCREEGGVRCPCLKCGCRRIISDPKEVETHLKRKGFKENYWVWTSNGEEMSMNMPETRVNVAYDEQQDSGDEEELPNEKSQKFYELLKEINTPLFEGSSDSKLSMCVRLLAAKSNWNVPDQCLEFFCQMMLDATPTKENLPRSYYDAKRLVMKLGLEITKIDCCIRGCMLFYDNEFGTNDGALEECKFCKSPRYVVRTKAIDRDKKRIAVKSMFYLPIIPRLQRLFASMHSSGTGYSCWPVIVTPYNLPPEMCMTKPYMFLTCLIPGPSSPKAGIDVYLQPLVDDLKRLWIGECTYDISRKQNFNMRAVLMWTINDFPAYAMLSGWGTHGKMGCPHCMDKTKAFTLDKGGKSSWFNCHRRFLPKNHILRKNMNDFRKGIKVTDLPPPRLSSVEVWNMVRDLPKFTDNGKAIRIPGYGDKHNWTKRSIFWDLPYWKDNLLRHNLDVMHIEKNFFDNVFNTVMDVQGKTKDNENARKDMELYCNRKDLELKTLPNGKLLKPKATYSLTPQEAKLMC
ncbi:uncharacterized protein LOC131614952 [Vicia villosa]|uniref:uncharacterized protein LOC131614952 n=1 Tax=Vicia villosa TaxID=3911 RepID=UPI00273C386C|nr:uncharacterized protein LOC131614952 [Vicia villosa]